MKLCFFLLFLLLSPQTGFAQAGIYALAHDTVADPCKPMYLLQKFLKEGDEKNFKLVLSQASLEQFNQLSSSDPSYFKKLQTKMANDGSMTFYTREEWKKLKGEEDKTAAMVASRLKPNQEVIIAESSNTLGVGGAVVVFENGFWRAEIPLKPIE